MGFLFELDLPLAKTSLCVVEGDVEVLGNVPRDPEPLLERLAGWAGDVASRESRPVRCRNRIIHVPGHPGTCSENGSVGASKSLI
jgi:hypothetical protein